MEQNVQIWSQRTKTIYNGVLIYIICQLLYTIFGSIGAVTVTNTFRVLAYALLAGVIIGYFIFFKGLTDFRRLLGPADSAAINRVRMGVLLGLIAAILGFIRPIAWLNPVLSAIGFILMLLGYNALKNSTTFPMEGRKGASRLFVAMILAIAGALLSLIPVAGGFINTVCLIVVVFMTLSGWAAIRDSSPAEVYPIS